MKKQEKQYLINLKRSLFLLSMLLFSTIMFGQNQRVLGVVVDSENSPIIRASVTVKGTKNVVFTDVDGKFNIVATANDKLIFRSSGMLTKEANANPLKSMHIVLEYKDELLDEMVVIGYGTQKKRDVTTAISTISTDDINKRPIVSAAQALQGKAAGVSVIKPSGSPGAEMVIRVRGTTSMNSSNNPLYVVDGVPLDNISFLSANDIESLQVLKDASSAAIYGSRAANGVVLITTKMGAKGETKITLNSYAGLTSLTKKIETLNVEQYRELLKDLGSKIVLPDNLTDKTDWYNETFQQALAQNYQISFSNATDKLKYYVSAGYTGEDGIIKVAYFERFNFRVNLENQIRKWLKISTNISYSDYKSNGVITGQGSNRAGVVLSVINTPSYAPIWDESNPNQYYSNFYGLNVSSPAENMARSADNKSSRNIFIGTGNIELSLLPNLKFKSSVTLNRLYSNSVSFLDPIKTSYGRSQNGRASDNRALNTTMIFDNILSYNKKIGGHYIDFMGGTSGTTSHYSNSYQTVQNFIDGSIKTLNAGNKVLQGNGTIAAESAMMSYIGRISYNYDSKYLVTANLRIDGSSKLNPNHRWGYFPSVSAAWRVSSENFMENLTWINDMKIRGGWGQTGNQAGLGDYNYLQRFVINKVNWWEDGKANAVPNITMRELRNSDLTWETTTQANLGVDLTVLKNRLTVSLDYYSKLTTNMLMYVALPPGSSTASTIARNEGEMTNKGLELSLNSHNIRTKDFEWSTDFNISTNKNKLTKLGLSQIYYSAKTSDNVTEYIVRNAPGHSLGGFYGYFSDGVDTETGELIYRDVDKNGFISTSDRGYIGDPNPDFVYGMTNTISYKNLNLTLFIQGSYGNDVYNASRMDTEGMYNAKNQSTRVLDRWRRPGMQTTIPKAGYDMKISSYFVEDGSFLRIKDLTLSYNIVSQTIRKLGITRLQPYMTGTNLVTFTKYLGFDPEVNQFGSSGTVQGIDWGTYPQTRTFIVGLNIEF